MNLHTRSNYLQKKTSWLSVLGSFELNLLCSRNASAMLKEMHQPLLLSSQNQKSSHLSGPLWLTPAQPLHVVFGTAAFSSCAGEQAGVAHIPRGPIFQRSVKNKMAGPKSVVPWWFHFSVKKFITKTPTG